MPDSFDLVVIGTGTAATTVATTCRKAGWTVAVADERPFGGTCPLRGCDPKKILWTVAETVDTARRLERGGIRGSCLSIGWSRLMAFKRSFTDPVPAAREKRFREAGIASLHGHARFVGPTKVAVNGRAVGARHVVVASGAIPRPLEIDGADLLLTSDDVLDLEALPDSLILVGGGYVSFELAHIARRAGARPIILHRDDQPLSPFEPELVARLVALSRAIGIEVHLETQVEAVERAGEGVLVHARRGNAPWRFEAAAAVHGAGRVPAIAGLDPQAGGLAVEDGKLCLEPTLRSVSNAAVYAAGDAAAAGPPLTPVASHDGEVVAANLLDGGGHVPDYTGVPSVVFTIPPLAGVGMTEADARRSGAAFRTHRGDMGDWQSVRRRGGDSAAFKVLVEEGSERILGAHLLHPAAEEIINLFALAMRAGLPAREMGRFLSAYPSGGSDALAMLP